MRAMALIIAYLFIPTLLLLISTLSLLTIWAVAKGETKRKGHLKRIEAQQNWALGKKLILYAIKDVSKKIYDSNSPFMLAACEAIFKAVFLELFFFSPKKIHFYYFASSLKLTLLPSFFSCLLLFLFFLFLPHIALFILCCSFLPSTISHNLFFPEIVKEHISNFQKLYIFLLLSLTQSPLLTIAFMLKRARYIHAGYLPAKRFWFRFLFHCPSCCVLSFILHDIK
jgi:hypothetical protein